MAVRMKDIARELGLSVVTVSKALRNHGDISEATRKRVMRRIERSSFNYAVVLKRCVSVWLHETEPWVGAWRQEEFGINPFVESFSVEHPTVTQKPGAKLRMKQVFVANCIERNRGRE